MGGYTNWGNSKTLVPRRALRCDVCIESNNRLSISHEISLATKLRICTGNNKHAVLVKLENRDAIIAASVRGAMQSGFQEIFIVDRNAVQFLILATKEF